MGNLRLYGSTSGYVEIAPPAVGGSQVLTLPTDSVQPGMVLVATQSFTSASSVSFNNIFTSAYDNYRVLVDLIGSTAQDLHLRYRTSGVDNTTSNYEMAVYRFFSTNSAGGLFYGSAPLAQLAKTDGTARTTSVDMTIFGPQKNQFTRNSHLSMHPVSGTTGTSSAFGGHGFMDSTVFDGITIYPNTGTITGIVRVYGYRNS